jgi:hypothetical protein
VYQCQYCPNTDIQEILYLGALPPVNDMELTDELQKKVNCFPLPFCHCDLCGLTQIGITLEREVVFPNNYPYLSGMTKSLLENFASQADEINNYLQLKKDDLVIDIGSNDGSLIQNYMQWSRVLGIEPTNAADVAISREIPTLKMYFDAKSTDEINSFHGKARLVTACNVFAHISDIPGLLKNIDKILTIDGIFVSESHYLVDLVGTLQFDTIYHEHLRYYTVTFLKKMFNEFGLDIFRVDSIVSHGGSIRVWACRQGKHVVSGSVEKFLKIESDAKIDNVEVLMKFSKDVISWRNEFRLMFSQLITSGAKIGGLGAPSRASTLITFSGLSEHDLFGIGEVSNSAKIGKNIPGTRIPVMTEAELLKGKPTHLLILSWHITDQIMSALRKKGYEGKFIIPLPLPKVVD